MIIYNVTIYIKKEIESEWLEWMKKTHIPEVVEAGSFLSYKMFKVIIPSGETGEATYSIQYECRSLESYLKYSEKEENIIKFQQIKSGGMRNLIHQLQSRCYFPLLIF
jgi:uncharacterized metal-binding protein